MVLLIGMTQTVFEAVVSERSDVSKGLASDSARLGLAVAAMRFGSFPAEFQKSALA